MRLSPDAMAGLVGGGLIGFSAAYLALESRFRKIYDQKAADLQQTYEFVKSLNTQKQFEMEDAIASMENEEDETLFEIPKPDLKLVAAPEDGTIMVTPIQEEPVQNAYHRAIAATETPIEKFVDGGVNDYGVSYIEEEEYQDDDGRLKEQILVYMDEYNPVFTEAGIPIDDWAEKIGDSIIVDFYRLVPPGVEPVLYVRNHRTGVDYEVIRQEP